MIADVFADVFDAVGDGVAVADDGVFVFLVGFFVRVFRVGLVDGC